MSQKIEIERKELDIAEDGWHYLVIFIDKYTKIWNADLKNIMQNLTEDQITLMMYGLLYNQVQNGGFIQAIFNGYGFIFDTDNPLTSSLKEWGATEVAQIIDKVGVEFRKEGENMLPAEGMSKDKSIEFLSALYQKYPQFDELDEEFYDNDGVDEIKSYVENHLNDFATIIQ